MADPIQDNIGTLLTFFVGFLGIGSFVCFGTTKTSHVITYLVHMVVKLWTWQSVLAALAILVVGINIVAELTLLFILSQLLSCSLGQKQMSANFQL